MCQFKRDGRRVGFTLIEVLVVVAIIALLISILVPSLKQARDLSRLLVCQTHLREVGKAVQMYVDEFKGNLPGPVHPLLLRHPDNPLPGWLPSKEQMEFYLSTRLRKYFSEKTYGKGDTTGQIGTCPSFPVEDSAFKGDGGLSDIPVFHYTVNTSQITGPNYFFGFTHGGVTDWKDWETKYGASSNKNAPPGKHYNKAMSRVKMTSREWMMADAFRRPFPKRTNWPKADELGCGNLPAANSQQPYLQFLSWGSCPPDIQVDGTAASARPVPSMPYHMGGGVNTSSKGAHGGGWFRGRVSTLFFDMHVEAQTGWTGSYAQNIYNPNKPY